MVYHLTFIISSWAYMPHSSQVMSHPMKIPLTSAFFPMKSPQRARASSTGTRGNFRAKRCPELPEGPEG